MSYSHISKLPVVTRSKVMDKIQGSQTIVDVLAWCIMPNHFHLLLKQTKNTGITTYLSHVANAFTKYFNTTQHRKGSLFEGPFKAVFIETEELLLHISRYIHLNPYVASLVSLESLMQYPWSSLQAYSDVNKTNFTKTEMLLSHFSDKDDYLRFITDHADYAKQLAKIKHLALEE